MSDDKTGIGYFGPGYKTEEDIAKEKRNRFYQEVIVPWEKNNKILVPSGTSPEKSPEDILLSAPIEIDITKYKPVKKTGFTPKELDNYMADQAKWKEKIRKFRQDPQWVKEHNERFGHISKTTVLPKTPVQRKREEYAQKIQDNKNKRSKQWTGGALKMAEEEAQHLNNIKRETWNNGGRVGPEPKYVSAQDVINVYEPKGPEATPVQLKGLHKRLKNHNERTGQFKNLPEEEIHPAEQSYLDQLNETIKKGKSITLPLLDPSLKPQKVESTNGRINNMNKGGTNGQV